MFEKQCVCDHLLRFEIIVSSHFVLFELVVDVSNVKCISKQFINYVHLKHVWNVRFRKKKRNKKKTIIFLHLLWTHFDKGVRHAVSPSFRRHPFVMADLPLQSRQTVYAAVPPDRVTRERTAVINRFKNTSWISLGCHYFNYKLPRNGQIVLRALRRIMYIIYTTIVVRGKLRGMEWGSGERARMAGNGRSGLC